MYFSREQIDFLQRIGVSINPSKPLSDEECELIEEKVSDYLQRKGFDGAYAPTEEGRLCESILDGLESVREKEAYLERREDLLGLVRAIEEENGLEQGKAVLIMHKLNSVEKISQFFKWVQSRFHHGKLHATEEEICEAAVQIAKEPRPVTEKRDKLLKALLDQGISTAELSEIVRPMRGKSQEEKEQIAAQIMEDRGIQ